MRPPGEERALLTDHYELTMAATFFAEKMSQAATFDLFVRELPPTRNFLIACGLEPALEYLESLRFTEEDLDYLRQLGIFDPAFLEFLGDLRFTGEVWALPEGEAVFPAEPLLRVTAPIIEAQIVETYLLNCVGFSTSVASKAARVAIACAGKRFVDFSARRDHGADAALLAARASFIGGAAATSNVLAAKRYGLQPSGTMAHSYVMAFPDERSAFEAFARRFPTSAVLLIDTFDTIEGARIAASVADGLATEGIRIQGVRIDSGDLTELTFTARKIFDTAGHPEIKIFLSGDLDEYRIAELVSAGAPADAFGVGTQLGTSADAAALGCVYKLVEDTSGPKFKLSPGKRTLSGVKQVYRTSRDRVYTGDVIALVSEPAPPGARPLLEQAMDGGHRTRSAALADLKERCRETLEALPEAIRSLGPADAYEVSVSPGLARRNESQELPA